MGTKNPLVAKLSQFAGRCRTKISVCLEALLLAGGALRAPESTSWLRAKLRGHCLWSLGGWRVAIGPDARRKAANPDHPITRGLILACPRFSCSTPWTIPSPLWGRPRIAGNRTGGRDRYHRETIPGSVPGLWWSVMQEEAMLRERIVALRPPQRAAGRVAYLFVRDRFGGSGAVGMAEDHAIRLPFTQTDLADMLGLTPVHTKPRPSKNSGARRADRARHIDASPYSTSRVCRRFPASRRIISSSTATPPRGAAVFRWPASGGRGRSCRSELAQEDHVSLLIWALLAAASPRQEAVLPPLRARPQHPKGLRLHSGGRRLEPLRFQSTLQQFANGSRAGSASGDRIEKSSTALSSSALSMI